MAVTKTLAIWATTQSKHVPKDGIQVQCVRYSSSGQRTLATSRRGIWTFKFYMYVFQICTHAYIYIFIKDLHPFHHPNLEKLKFSSCPNLMISNLQPLHLLKCFWNDDIFVPTPSLWNWLLRTNGQSKQMLMIVSANALDIRVVWNFQIHWNAPGAIKG